MLVHGDTSSAFGAALAAFHLGVPVVHVEAGLRAGSGNMTPFPEELNRRLVARIACLHLAPTATNQENLVRENVPIKQIYVTGNSAIDALSGPRASTCRSSIRPCSRCSTATSASCW